MSGRTVGGEVGFAGADELASLDAERGALPVAPRPKESLRLRGGSVN
jgi:hypothetical protein